jgi:2-dehydropantoate 2-reductase
MRIVIVGAGAIGSLFGALLSRGGHEVIFIEPREEVVGAINEAGIGLLPPGRHDSADLDFVPAKAVFDADGIEGCDGILLTVKAFDTLAAMRGITRLITRESPVISLQTALGVLELMEKVERRRNIVGGYTFMAAVALGPGRVHYSGRGRTYLGELDGAITPRVQRLYQAFNDSHIDSEVIPGIIGRLWSKAIVYSAINPVSAILRVKNGRLLEKMESVSLLKRLIDEGLGVAEACEIELAREDLYDLLFDACQRTAGNISTMLQDLLGGRRTEIDYLNGALLRYGRERSIPVTTHQAVSELVRLLEKWGFERD